MFTCVRPIHKQKMLVWCYGCAGVRLAALCFQHFPQVLQSVVQSPKPVLSLSAFQLFSFSACGQWSRGLVVLTTPCWRMIRSASRKNSSVVCCCLIAQGVQPHAKGAEGAKLEGSSGKRSFG